MAQDSRTDRRAAAERYGILDTPPEPAFERIVALAQRVMDAPIALISFVDGPRLWFKARRGVEIDALPLELAMCRVTLESDAVVCLPDLSRDPMFADNPLVTGPEGLRSYTGVALRTPEGVAIGTLCVLDTAVRPEASEADRAVLRDLAAIVMDELATRLQTRETAELATRATLRADLVSLAAEAPDLASAVSRSMARICAETGALIGVMWRRLPGIESLQPVGGHATAPVSLDAYLAAVRGARHDAGTSLVGEADLTDRPVIAADLDHPDYARYARLAVVRALGMRAVIAVPLSLGRERAVLSLGFGPVHGPLERLATLLGAAAEALRPLLLRHVQEGEAALLRRVVAESTDQVVITDAPQEPGQPPRIVYVNPAFEQASGFAAAEVRGQPLDTLWGPEADAQVQDRVRDAMAAGRAIQVEQAVATADGRGFWAALTLSPVLDPGGWTSHWVIVQRDITDQRREAARLAASEAAFRGLFHANPIPMWLHDPATLAILEVNEAAVRSYGYTRAQFLTLSVDDLRPRDDPSRRTAVAQGGVDGRISGPWRHIDAEGHERRVEIVPHHFTAPQGPRVLVAAWDVTERHEAAEAAAAATEALRTQSAQLRQAQELARLGSWYCSGVTGVVHWSDELYRMLGLDPAVANASHINVMTLVHPDDRDQLTAHFVTTLKTGAPMALDVRAIRPDGGTVHLRIGGRRRFDRDGLPLIDGYAQDMTDRHEAAAALLRSEKLRTVGQLTGGIAHDFNNLLTVILGSLELAAEAVAEGAACAELIANAQAAAERGAALTGQLLSFARRQPLRAVPIELGDFLPDLVSLVSRTLGDTHPLRIVAESGLAPVLADRAQLETALINLIINARDASPRGGTIGIELSQVMRRDGDRAGPDDLTPGRYGVIAVSDLGTGMTAEVRARAFEPFFTTKPMGQGTGLGLSMVLGFAKQSGGTVTLESLAGMGTTVRLYLPCATVAGAQLAPNVLVVVGDAALSRDLIACCLENGAEALALDSAEAAIRAVTGKGAIDLVVVDRDAGLQLDRLLAALPGGADVLRLAEPEPEARADTPRGRLAARLHALGTAPARTPYAEV